MKPLGRKHIKFPNKVDIHPGRGYVNWWESRWFYSDQDKRSDRRKTKIKLKGYVDDK
jgi:hypothetical protein